MFNLPVGNQLNPISATETIQIRVVKFNTNQAIRLRDVDGNLLPPTANFRDGRVSFTGPIFAFTLAASGTPAGRQAIDIEFFRAQQVGQVGLLTQQLAAVIVTDDANAFNTLDLSVPLPSEMDEKVIPCQPTLYYEMPCQPCQPCWPRRRGLFRR